MARFITGLFGPKKKRKLPKYIIVMHCGNCGRLYEASRASRPCPVCGSTDSTLPASKWLPCRDDARPKYRMGNVAAVVTPAVSGGGI